MADAPKTWVIRKRGLFYRPDRCGYTSCIYQAGRYAEAEARQEAAVEPETMSAHPASEFEGKPPAALAERHAEIAKLRAENDRWQRVAGRHLDCAMADIAEIARLRAGITAAVEGRYERQGVRPASWSPGTVCEHGSFSRHCRQCLLAHLLALLDPPPAPDGGEAKR